MYLMIKTIENNWYEDKIRHPPFVSILGFLPICIGIPISFICNNKLKRKTHISDTEETIESMILSVFGQVLVFWMIKKCFAFARVYMLIETDLLQISMISESKVFSLHKPCVDSN